MLETRDATATIAVRDIAVAQSFYKDTLGLKPIPTGEQGVLSYKSGNSSILVYESRYAGTNKATAATWVVDGEVESIVRDLKDRGVAFEHYDVPGLTLKGDVHVGKSIKAAWFKDPDGNILQVVGK